MTLESAVTASLILLDAVVIGLSFHRTRIIRGMLGKGSDAAKWKVHSFLMMFFLMGYLASVFLVLSGFSRFLALVAGVIFLS